MADAIKFEVQESIAIVTIDRGGKKNALTRSMMRELTRIALDLQDRLDIHAVVLTGTVEYFSAGVDLKEIAEWNETSHELLERRSVGSIGAKMCKAWEDIPQITICAIEGLNVGGGIALTLGCDLRVMAEDAYLFVPEVQIGIPLVWQTIPRLVALVGLPRTKKILYFGEKMPATVAESWGLADYLCKKGEAKKYALQLARQVAALPPATVQVTKQAANSFANALNHVASFADVDQSILFGLQKEADTARKKFK